ncbi:methyltransferase domain-containing protein [Mariprofundus sp. EBB-1]|uniref:methyltransferase domain-containing protein n=1 Tax=Mariprofundus sp. EBB-1 TaxID=2650971 RepID=UPI000EF19F9A|nr:methyltransferase domain-containing protein [Mariprofundus sp. EBB-1]RLL49753.1 methyltransferase domain-containing protein [Mariprofundus sp. EBB-1]
MKVESLNWEERYQAGDIGWDRGGPSPALMQWLDDEAVKEGARVLIPGCGYGHEVIELAGRGHAATGLDIAPSAITALHQSLNDISASRSEAVCADLFDYHPSERFDAVYEQTCLCTMTPTEYVQYEKKLYGWLNDGGVLLLLLMQTGDAGGPPYHCDLKEMRQLFDPSRWAWPGKAPMIISRPKGPRFELGFVLQRKS